MYKKGLSVKAQGAELAEYYSILLKHFGAQGWWPARTRFEMIVGAILTQNTAWTNVEKAIARLRAGGLLTPGAIHAIKSDELASYITSAGYYNIKAARIKNFTGYLYEGYCGSLSRLFKRPDKELRSELLGIKGIGPETADSIMLYAARRPEFVVDAYTKRIFSRHAFIDSNADYEKLKALFMDNLRLDERVFNEYHALIVKTGKDYCKSRAPLCGFCPLGVKLR